MLDDATGGFPGPEMEKLFDAVIARRRLLYPDLDRMITGVHVSMDGDGRCTIKVSSAVYAARYGERHRRRPTGVDGDLRTAIERSDSLEAS